MKKFALILLALLSRVAPGTAGTIIDFETLPGGGTPYDGMVVSNQWASLGVNFRFGNGTFPILATPGGTNWAFFGPPNSSQTNIAAAGETTGRFFLTDTSSGQPPNLIIDYTTPVSAASGVIIDVDHEDAWKIEARDINTNVIANLVATLTPNVLNSGDGVATPWSVSTNLPVIYSIRVRFTGTSPRPGLAFDNFSPTNALPSPAPATLALTRSLTTNTLTVAGTPSALYRIERTTTLSSNWSAVTNLYLPGPSAFITDVSAATNQFYRAVGLQ
jgi:hypothetical protein